MRSSKALSQKKATAFAPATSGNLGVGFDILGIALAGLGDEVTVSRTDQVGIVKIEKISMPGLSLEPLKNTASAGLVQMLQDFNSPFGFKVHIKKGIPLGSGLGGSAASAVAGVVAANALLKKPLPKSELLKYTLIGEAVASGGAPHADNVAPCLLGGLRLIQGENPKNLVSIPFPNSLVMVLVLPNCQVETKLARQVLQSDVKLSDVVKQTANLSAFLAGCFQKDLKLIAASFEDLLIEPQRAHLIPGFYAVKKAAIEQGALGCTISGAGPTMLALASRSKALAVKKAMIRAFEKAGAGPVKSWLSKLDKKGAYLK